MIGVSLGLLGVTLSLAGIAWIPADIRDDLEIIFEEKIFEKEDEQ